VSRAQFIVLNVVGGLCAVFIVCDLVLGVLNGRLNRSVAETQNRFGQAQQLHKTAENVLVRVAELGRTDPALRDLLARHKFQVNLNTNSTARPSR
jgi:hypothetical protein